MNATASTADAISREIYRQISARILMSLGAHQMGCTGTRPGEPDHYAPGLTFLAKILAFRKDGTRGSTARIMRITITLNSADLYDIDVRYAARRSVVGDSIHFQRINVPVGVLNILLLALDYDGPEVLNPRLVS